MAHVPRGEAVLPLLTIALFVLMFVAWPLSEMGVLQRPLPGMTMLVVVLASLFALGNAGRLAPVVVTLGLVVFCFQVTTLIRPLGLIALLNDLAAGMLVLLLCVLLLKAAIRSGPVTMNRIIGAIAVYLLFGLFFALTFDLLERLAPGAFNMGPQPTPLTPSGARFFYLSIITLTSVGFGDMAPVHPFARSLVNAGGYSWTDLYRSPTGSPRFARGPGPLAKSPPLIAPS
jgi:hypothetical protein